MVRRRFNLHLFDHSTKIVIFRELTVTERRSVTEDKCAELVGSQNRCNRSSHWDPLHEKAGVIPVSAGGILSSAPARLDGPSCGLYVNGEPTKGLSRILVVF
jgi:hypothetical protein